MTDTYLDGGGVLADQPLPHGAWIRYNPGTPDTAITVHTDDGGLRITGHYRPLCVERVAGNEVRVTSGTGGTGSASPDDAPDD